MANKTAQNYAATQGGYTSAGQRAYMDQQRAYNDAMARLYNQGISNARSMYQSDVTNQQNALGAYGNAYGLGKEYSDIEQYNYMVDQMNNPWNQLLGAAPAVGALGGAAVGALVGNPMLGASLGSQLGQGVAGTTAIGGTSGADNPWTSLATGIYNTTASSPQSWINLFNINRKPRLSGGNINTGDIA